jgi:hypothetical protein
MVHHLIYASRAKEGLALKELQAVLDAAEIFNTENNITGALVFGRGMFLQVIEGERTRLSTLYHKLLKDERHMNIELMEFQEKPAREFPAWRMKLVRLPESNAGKSPRSLQGQPFDPFKLTAQTAIEVLKELCNADSL